MTCSVEGCDRVIRSQRLSLCNMHYQRFMNKGDVGSPNRLKADPGEARAYIEQAILHKNKKTCLIWPYSRNLKGYAQVNIDGPQLVSRIICVKVNGKPKRKRDEARHICGKGHEGCINPHHVIWGSPKQNAADKIKHGTHKQGEQIPSSKLTVGKVLRILELIGKGWSDPKISDKFNVSSKAIFKIRKGLAWKHVPRD